MTIATSDRQQWLSPSRGAQLLGIAPGSLKKVAPQLGIRCLVIPGLVGKRYNRADIERAKAELEEAAAATVAVTEQTSGSNHRMKETARPR